jgi:hypothetical protein
MAKKKNVKNPYRGYTLPEIMDAEKTTSVIHLGGDLYCDDGHFTLDNDKAQQIYEKILVSLLKMINDGTDKERRDGLRLLPTLFIRPLRVH